MPLSSFANNNLDANNYFNNLNGLGRPQFKRNQFGFTAGGPVYIPHFYKQRDKTFIFGTYEGLRQQTPTTLITTVPTELQRSGQLPGLNLPGDLKYVNGDQRGVYNTNYTNFAPRVGLAYSAFKNFVFRAGYGIFYTPAIEFGDYQGLSLNGYSQTTPYVGTLDGVTPQNLLSNPFPTGLLAPVGQADGGATNVGQSINAVLRGRASPYVQQWTSNFQYQVGATVLQAAYIGNHGTKLLFGSSTTELDQLPTADLALGNQLLQQVPNPFYGVITTGALSSPTVAYGQLLRPFPEYTGVEDVQPRRLRAVTTRLLSPRIAGFQTACSSWSLIPGQSI